MKLNEPRTISTRGSYVFTNRTLNLWNSLSDSIATAPTVNCFQRRYNKIILYSVDPLFLIGQLSLSSFLGR